MQAASIKNNSCGEMFGFCFVNFLKENPRDASSTSKACSFSNFGDSSLGSRCQRLEAEKEKLQKHVERWHGRRCRLKLGMILWWEVLYEIPFPPKNVLNIIDDNPGLRQPGRSSDVFIEPLSRFSAILRAKVVANVWSPGCWETWRAVFPGVVKGVLSLFFDTL